MPRDDWKRASDRAKYGPVQYKKRKKQRPKKKVVEKKPSRIWVFIIHVGTPALAIKPNGTRELINTTKTLRFSKQATNHRIEGFSTFNRRGFYLIVENKHVGRDTMKA